MTFPATHAMVVPLRDAPSYPGTFNHPLKESAR